jgi:hypothetical protein
MIFSDELGSMYMKAAAAYFKIVYLKFPEAAEQISKSLGTSYLDSEFRNRSECQGGLVINKLRLW